jgi:hypothetical protein
LVAGVAGGTPETDFGLQSTQPAANVLQLWRALPHAVGHGFGGLVVSRQVHGCRIAVHAQGHTGLLVQHGFDGHVSAVPGLLLALTVADCVPIYLAAPGGGAWGLLHAGWRGIAAGIVEAGVSRLAERAECAVGDVVMHCGISICGQCYEVGPEVATAVLGPQGAGSPRLDLRGAIADRARHLGLTDVTLSDWCTAHHPERYQSHRASGGVAGRMAAFLGRPA